MWRAFFLAVGIYLIMLGTQFLVVERVVLADSRSSAAAAQEMPGVRLLQPGLTQQSRRVYKPKDWMPWSLLAAGAIVVIYTYSLPKRSAG